MTKKVWLSNQFGHKTELIATLFYSGLCAGGGNAFVTKEPHDTAAWCSRSYLQRQRSAGVLAAPQVLGLSWLRCAPVTHHSACQPRNLLTPQLSGGSANSRPGHAAAQPPHPPPPSQHLTTTGIPAGKPLQGN